MTPNFSFVFSFAQRMTEPVVELRSVDVALNGTTVLHNINWQLRPGEHWPCWAATAQAKARSCGSFAATFGDTGKESAFIGSVPWSARRLRGQNRISLVSPELHTAICNRVALTGCKSSTQAFRTAITLTPSKTPNKTLCGRNRRLAGHAPFAPPQCPAAFNGRITKTPRCSRVGRATGPSGPG